MDNDSTHDAQKAAGATWWADLKPSPPIAIESWARCTCKYDRSPPDNSPILAIMDLS